MPTNQLPNLSGLYENLKEIYFFLISPELQSKLFAPRVVALVLSVFFAVALFYYLKRGSYLRYLVLDDFGDWHSFRDFGEKKWTKRWKKIKRKLKKSTSSPQLKLALIEGYKMLDDVLKRMGLGEGKIEDRLQKATVKEIANLEELKKASRICGEVARNPEHSLPKEEAENILETIERTFRNIRLF